MEGGGARDLDNQVAVIEKKLEKAYEDRETAYQTAGQYIYNLAQYAAEVAPKKHEPLLVFRAMCGYAEVQFKERRGVSNLKQALPVWTVYKSNISAGFSFGLDPRDFTTEWEFRKALNEARAPSLSHEVTKLPSDAVTKPQRMTQEVATDVFRQTTISQPLQTLLARLVLEADYIRKNREEEAIAILRRALGELNELLDMRRVKDSDTRDALEKPVRLRRAA
jgi:hypothetical protein